MSVQVKGSGTIGGLDEGLVVSGIVTSSTQINVGSNIKLGNAGVVTATSFVGSGANLTSLPSQLTLSNNADNRVITGGSGTNLNGESNLTFNGSILAVTGEITPSSHINLASGKKLSMAGDVFKIYHSTNAAIINESGDLLINQNVSNKDIKISTGSGPTERLRIASNSQLLHIRTDNVQRYDLEFRNTGGIGDGNYGGIHWTQSASGTTNLAAIEIAYANNGRPDIVFKNRQSGGTSISEALRITSDGKIGINESSPDGMLHIKGGVPAIFLEDSDGTHGQAIIEQNGDILKIRQDAGNASSGTGSVIQFEVDAQAYAKVDTAFGLKADNTCKAWLCYRSEAGNEAIIDDFNVATVNDEGTGTFGVNLEVNVHRHGNGWSQSIVFGCYNDGSRQLIAGVGYAPSHGSNNPWWDVEDNFVRVQTNRSDNGAVLDAKVFNMAMFGDTGDLHPA